MCLAEALLRIPDDETRDALIRDKIGGGDWRAHLGHSPSLFVNAATWGLLLTGRLTATSSEREPVGRADAPDRARRRAADPHRRQSRHAPDGRAVRRRPDHRRGAGERPRRWRRKGFRYSYDMLGEAAVTAAQADHYMQAYEQAIHAIGRAARPAAASTKGRASRSSSRRCIRATAAPSGSACMAELYPRLKALAVLARTLRYRPQHRCRGSRPAGDSRSTCWSGFASSPSWRAGTASASSSRPIRSARASRSTG